MLLFMPKITTIQCVLILNTESTQKYSNNLLVCPAAEGGRCLAQCCR